MAKDAMDLILGATQSAGSGGGGGADLPEHSAADADKVLTVQDDNSLAWEDIPTELPAHTASDAGKVPVVQDDNSLAWETPAGGVPAHAAADDGKVLTVQQDGSIDWEDAPKELPSYNNLNSKMLLKVNLAGNGLEWGTKDDAAMLKASLDYSIYRNTGTIKVNGTSVTTRTNYFDLWYDGVFHGYRHLHKISAAGGISANSTLVFSNFKVPERCSELYVFTGSGSYEYVQRANIKNITPTSHSLSLSSTYAPADVYAYDFEIEISASLAKNDYIMTLFIPCGLDLASYTAAHGVPTHAAADAGKVPVVQNDGTLAWQTPSGGGGESELPEYDEGNAGDFLQVADDGSLWWTTPKVPAYEGNARFCDQSGQAIAEDIYVEGVLKTENPGLGKPSFIGIDMAGTADEWQSDLTLQAGSPYQLTISNMPIIPKAIIVTDRTSGNVLFRIFPSPQQQGQAYIDVAEWTTRYVKVKTQFVLQSSVTIAAGASLGFFLMM